MWMAAQYRSTEVEEVQTETISCTWVGLWCAGCPAWCPGWCSQTPGGEPSPARRRWRTTAGSRSPSKHEWSVCPASGGSGRGHSLVVTSAGLRVDTACSRPPWTHLSVGALLRRGLHHHVTLHAHLQLGDVGGNAAVAGGPQRAQELSSPDGVHDHGAVLAKGNKKAQWRRSSRLSEGLYTLGFHSVKSAHGHKCEQTLKQ